MCLHAVRKKLYLFGISCIYVPSADEIYIPRTAAHFTSLLHLDAYPFGLYLQSFTCAEPVEVNWNQDIVRKMI